MQLNPLRLQCDNNKAAYKVPYLLDVSLGEGKLGRHMEHNLSPSEDSEDRFRPRLSVGHIQPPAEPATLSQHTCHALCVASSLR